MEIPFYFLFVQCFILQGERHRYYPGNSKGFRNSVSGTGLKDQIVEDAPSALVTRELTRLSGALCQARGAEAKCI